jgi:hypothetical protein
MYPAAADYRTLAYGYPPSQGRYRVSRNLWLVIAAVVVVVVLLLGTIGYVLGGYAYASSRITAAAIAVNAVNAHRSYVNTAFTLLDQQVGSLDTMTDNKLAKATSSKLVSESESMSTTVAGDEHELMAARSRLNDQTWLTAISAKRLATEAGRIDLARQAVASAGSAAHDYVMFGKFLQVYYQALIDWDTMVADAKISDFVGTNGADVAMQADVAKALDESNAPGLPQEFHDYLIGLQAYAADVSKLLNAITADNKTGVDAANRLIQADITELNAVNFTATTGEIRFYYQRYRDDFNREMDRATK